ncbi:MAG: hypothetical protein M1380_10920 [Chloroflexi bacterium]|nr:hypothetical protein [Chloroflexota bacterium]
MATARSVARKCTTEECKLIAKRASALHPLLDDQHGITERARLFQALGNETRLQILGLLS